MNRYQRRYPGSHWFEKVLHRRVAAVLANSTAVKAELEHEEGGSPARLGLIYNGVDCARFHDAKPRTEVRRSLDIPRETRVLCILANLIPYKGHRDLLEALATVRHRLPPWRLLCVGGGNAGALRAAAASLGIEEHVLWLGARADVADLLCASDIGILAPHEEGFSDALLEYMAARLPAVATTVGGNVEAAVDGETGFLVPPHDPRKLAEALVRLAGNAEVARQLGAAGRSRVETFFSEKRCVEDYHRVFTAVASGEPLPRDITAGRGLGR